MHADEFRFYVADIQKTLQISEPERCKNKFKKYTLETHIQQNTTEIGL